MFVQAPSKGLYKMKVILVLLGILLIMYCCENSPKIERDYELVLDDDDILVEQFDSTKVDENRFTANNTIFKEGTQFFYSFNHIDKKGEKYHFEYLDSISNWKFLKAGSSNKKAIKEVIITVRKGLQPFINFLPDYNQTVISYGYPTENGPSKFNSSSGVIENEGNIWMHPPRDQYFEILELNPFPYIKSPFEKGNKWNWDLIIGDNWADARWKTWTGQIKNQYEYEIVGQEEIKTKLGKVKCYVIDSWAESRIGKTYLTCYFNPEYGFVKLDYTNIDRSKTILELTKKLNQEHLKE